MPVNMQWRNYFSHRQFRMMYLSFILFMLENSEFTVSTEETTFNHPLAYTSWNSNFQVISMTLHRDPKKKTIE
jgi:hypothetical protein